MPFGQIHCAFEKVRWHRIAGVVGHLSCSAIVGRVRITGRLDQQEKELTPVQACAGGPPALASSGIGRSCKSLPSADYRSRSLVEKISGSGLGAGVIPTPSRTACIELNHCIELIVAPVTRPKVPNFIATAAL